MMTVGRHGHGDLASPARARRGAGPGLKPPPEPASLSAAGLGVRVTQASGLTGTATVRPLALRGDRIGKSQCVRGQFRRTQAPSRRRSRCTVTVESDSLSPVTDRDSDGLLVTTISCHGHTLVVPATRRAGGY